MSLHLRGLGQLMWANSFVKWDRSGITAFLAHPDVTARHLVAVIRYSAHWSFFALLGDTFAHAAAQELRRRLKSAADLQVAADLWVEMGGKRPTVEYLQQAWQASTAQLDQEMLWPLVAGSFDEIDEALGLRPQVHQPALHAGNALDLLATLPKVPHRYMLALLNLATETQKSLRLQARALLAGAPDIDKAIIDLLGDGKQEVRAGAADWLTARGTQDAVPALRKALNKEKSEIARAAIITALERLGDDVSDCFEPKGMLADAEAGLAKTSIKGLEWFPFDLLPRVSWQNGKPVDPRIVRWWVVLANKLKQPGSNALLDLWLARLVPDDAKRFGLFVLKSWIEHDTRRPSDEEGNAFAAANIDAALAQRKQTVQRYDPARQRIVAERLHFTGRSRRQLPWTIILCVDQSGSMLGSVIYAAVMAAILAALPSVDVRLVVFDTSVVDLSREVADPVSVLMSVQLGGGTDIGRAVAYCEQLITQPSRSIFVLLSDFCEGGSVAPMIAAVQRMASAQVTLIGLAALDDQAATDYDRATAQRLADAGMKIAALTPDRFAEWIAGIIG